jgi:hypothetical protein
MGVCWERLESKAFSTDWRVKVVRIMGGTGIAIQSRVYFVMFWSGCADKLPGSTRLAGAIEDETTMYKHIFGGLLTVSFLLGGATGLAGDLQQPELVKTGLRSLAKEYGDMDRKLAARLYDRLPKESREFREDSEAIRDAIAKEPVDFKGQVERQLDVTLQASQHVADVSASHDASQVKAALSALADSLTRLNALFPGSLRSAPGSVPARGGSGTSPPPTSVP